jgi:hypothetical protein
MDHNLITPGGAIVVDNTLMKVLRPRPPGRAPRLGATHDGQLRVSSVCMAEPWGRPVRAAWRAAKERALCAGRVAHMSLAAA